MVVARSYFLAHAIRHKKLVSQRGRAMLLVVEYFAKSLKVTHKVIRNDTLDGMVWYGIVVFNVPLDTL